MPCQRQNKRSLLIWVQESPLLATSWHRLACVSLLPLHHQGSLGGELSARGPALTVCDSLLSLRKEGCGLASWARGHGPLACTLVLVLS